MDRKRFVTGGALSNGGGVYAWMKRNLQPAGRCRDRKATAAMLPGLHGLTVLPLFAGERSTGMAHGCPRRDRGPWRPPPRRSKFCMRRSKPSRCASATSTKLWKPAFGAPKEVIGSGGALLHSAVWTSMMADTLGHSVQALPGARGHFARRGAAGAGTNGGYRRTYRDRSRSSARPSSRIRRRTAVSERARQTARTVSDRYSKRSMIHE